MTLSACQTKQGGRKAVAKAPAVDSFDIANARLKVLQRGVKAYTDSIRAVSDSLAILRPLSDANAGADYRAVRKTMLRLYSRGARLQAAGKTKIAELDSAHSKMDETFTADTAQVAPKKLR
jgi:hypothetical protein